MFDQPAGVTQTGAQLVYRAHCCRDDTRQVYYPRLETVKAPREKCRGWGE